jgi:hypothetical protein
MMVEDIVEGLVVLALATVQERRVLGRPLVRSMVVIDVDDE